MSQDKPRNWTAAGFIIAIWLLLTVLVILLTVRAEPGQSPPANEGTRYLFYLHGRIVEDQGRDAVSEHYGKYEYDAIVEALKNNGHVVISEARPRGTNPWDYAREVAKQIEELETSGAPSGHVTVVGASKGAAIAVLVSHLMKDREINYVLLAICGVKMVEYWQRNDICVSGNILSIYDASDNLSGSCANLAVRCNGQPGRFHEIELHTGTEHGLVYRPIKEWLDPTLAWASRADLTPVKNLTR